MFIIINSDKLPNVWRKRSKHNFGFYPFDAVITSPAFQQSYPTLSLLFLFKLFPFYFWYDEDNACNTSTPKSIITTSIWTIFLKTQTLLLLFLEVISLLLSPLPLYTPLISSFPLSSILYPLPPFLFFNITNMCLNRGQYWSFTGTYQVYCKLQKSHANVSIHFILFYFILFSSLLFSSLFFSFFFFLISSRFVSYTFCRYNTAAIFVS